MFGFVVYVLPASVNSAGECNFFTENHEEGFHMRKQTQMSLL